MTGGDVILLDRDGGAGLNLTEGHPRSYLSVHWEPDGTRLLCAAIEDGEATLGYLGLDGAFDVVLAGARLDPALRGRSSLTFARRSACHRPRRPNAASRGLHDRPEHWRVTPPHGHQPVHRGARVASIETLRWRSFDGLEIQGLLARPAVRRRDSRCQRSCSSTAGQPACGHTTSPVCARWAGCNCWRPKATPSSCQIRAAAWASARPSLKRTTATWAAATGRMSCSASTTASRRASAIPTGSGWAAGATAAI